MGSGCAIQGEIPREGYTFIKEKPLQKTSSTPIVSNSSFIHTPNVEYVKLPNFEVGKKITLINASQSKEEFLAIAGAYTIYVNLKQWTDVAASYMQEAIESKKTNNVGNENVDILLKVIHHDTFVDPSAKLNNYTPVRCAADLNLVSGNLDKTFQGQAANAYVGLYAVCEEATLRAVVKALRDPEVLDVISGKL